MSGFERITFKEAGLASFCVVEMMESIKDICMHGFMLMRNGKLFAEKYRDGITADSLQRLYSVTKTFVSAAIGILYTEGKIKLDDKITELFNRPSKYKWVNDMTVRDCLMMCTCYNGTTYKLSDKNWLDTFLDGEPTHPAGTIFHYDTSATHTLGTLVERITGKRLMEFLRERLGLSEGVDCVQSPEGISWGGSGGIASMNDMARLAEFFRNGGVLDGKRIIAEDYVRAATSKQTDNDNGFNNRWTSGYGYQIWITEYGFAIFGAGSQFAFCAPEKGLTFVCTATTLGNDAQGRRIEDAFKRCVLERLDKGLEDTEESVAEYESKKLELPRYESVDEHIQGCGEYVLEPNNMGISEIALDCEKGELLYKTNRGDKTLVFGKDEYRAGVLDEKQYFGMRIGESANRGYSYLASGNWCEKNKFHIKLWVTDIHTGSVEITLVFKSDEIAVCMRKNGEWYLDEYSGFAGGAKKNR